MRFRRKSRRAPAWAWLIFSLSLAFLLYAICGCAFLKSSRDALLVAGGGAGGAVVGSLAGPIGTVAGAGIGAGTVHALEDNASLREGEYVGRGALERELARHAGSVVYVQRKGFFWWAGISLCAFMALKYGLPWLRSAKNFWGGLRRVVTGDVGQGLHRMVSSTGIAHTSSASEAAANQS